MFYLDFVELFECVVFFLSFSLSLCGNEGCCTRVITYAIFVHAGSFGLGFSVTVLVCDVKSLRIVMHCCL